MASKYFERMGLRVELTEKRDYGLMFAYERMKEFFCIIESLVGTVMMISIVSGVKQLYMYR